MAEVAEVADGPGETNPSAPDSKLAAVPDSTRGRTAWGVRTDRLLDSYLFEACRADPDQARRGRLIVRFGFLGFLFGLFYAAFYLAIGHHWGAAIIVVCSIGFAAMPVLLKARQNLSLPGNLLVAIMTAGFTGLCMIEDGMNGHAIAWLVSVPLCALLMVGQRAAVLWSLVAFLAGTGLVVAHLFGAEFTATYDPRWHFLLTAAGYLGLIAFMTFLGLIFERGRLRAFRSLQEALVQLSASNEKLIHLNNEKNEFLGIAAHDLKNPLSTIIVSAELIRMIQDPVKISRMAENIQASGGRMRDLINTLLDANAIEEGRYSSNIECCEMTDLIRQSVEHNQANADRKQIVLELNLEANTRARADRSATVQVLDNLISNAIKYSPPGSRVRIQSVLEPGHIRVLVVDQGPGLTVDDQKKLFRKFTRLSAKPTGGESSTGLGLSIVKRLVEAMAGTIECQSQPGQGAAFVVQLPVWPSESPAADKSLPVAA